jgi:hypothetical protein
MTSFLLSIYGKIIIGESRLRHYLNPGLENEKLTIFASCFQIRVYIIGHQPGWHAAPGAPFAW